jgi:hypothetical protein
MCEQNVNGKEKKLKKKGTEELEKLEQQEKLKKTIKDLQNGENETIDLFAEFLKERQEKEKEKIKEDLEKEKIEKKKNEIETIIKKMLDEKEGLEIKDRSWRLKTYKKCFIGSEFVTWLLKNYSEKYKTREAAVNFGQQLIDSYYIHHTVSSEP